MKYILLIGLFFFCFLMRSCVIDTVKNFCNVKNTSKRNITIRFSNSALLDTSTLFNGFWNKKIEPNTNYEVLIYSDMYMKESYKGNNKRLYLFFLDQDSISQLFKKGEIDSIISKSLLQKKIVDISNIKETDTLFYKEVEKD